MTDPMLDLPEFPDSPPLDAAEQAVFVGLHGVLRSVNAGFGPDLEQLKAAARVAIKAFQEHAAATRGPKLLALVQSPEPDTAVREMQKATQLWIIAVVRREEEWLRGQLERLEPGDSLCVHPRQTMIDGDHRGYTHTWTTSVHLLPKGYVCPVGGGMREVFGPMPRCPAFVPCKLRLGHPGACVPV